MTQASSKWANVNWRQAAGEALLLLIGVILALAAQAWWETRTERETVRGYVANLQVEVQENKLGLENIIEEHQKKVEQCLAMMRLMESAL